MKATYEQLNKVTFKQISIMKHAIGFERGRIIGNKNRRYPPYRNYFDCGEADKKDWDELVEIGFARNYNGTYYCVTEDGKEFLYYVTGVEILKDMD